MTSAFRSLRLHNFRIWFVGGFIGNNGQWMQTTAQSWVVLTVLTDNDASAVGLTLALQFLPPLLLVGLTGWVADRVDRRSLLAVSQAGFAAIALAMGLLLLGDSMTLPLMMLLATAFGTVAAFENPARQAFVSDLVAGSDIPNAVGLNSASFSGARLTGPAAAGIAIVAVGSGWVFVANAVCYLVTFASLLLLRRQDFILAPRPTATGFADGFRYVGRRPDLVVLFVMLVIFGAFGMNFPIYASTMAIELGRDADGFGFLASLFAVGSLTGSLVVAGLARPRLRRIVGAAFAYGVASAVSAVMPAFWWYGATIVFVGFALITMLTTANSYIQITTDAAVRGRVFAVYSALLLGSTPLGAPIVGWIADAWGARAAVGVAAGAGFLVSAIGLVWYLSVVSRRRRLNRAVLAGRVYAKYD